MTTPSPDPSSSKFTTPALDSDPWKSTSPSSTNTPGRPKKPPDDKDTDPWHATLPTPTANIKKSVTPKRRASVAFAEQVNYSTYTFFPSPLATNTTTRQSLPDDVQKDTDTVEAVTLEPKGLGLKSLPTLPQRTKSDDEVITAAAAAASPKQRGDAVSVRSRLKAKTLRRAASSPETFVLGVLWMLYLSWLAGANS